MQYPTIRIDGSIFSADIIDRIEQGELTGQQPKDFGFEGKVKDEIARAWADAGDIYRIFKRQRLKAEEKNESGVTETRNYWMIPLLGLLGYKPEFQRSSETVNEKSYLISHKDLGREGFPIHIIGFNESMDKKRSDTGIKMSPHAMLQEYINQTEHLFAMVSNGFLLRILRDSSRLTKLSYIEFDLERMMEEEHFSDFAVMFRLVHASRMPLNKETGAESLIEVYHQDSLESGSRIREGLSDAVKNAIIKFGNGFLNHKGNQELVQRIEENKLKPSEYFHEILHLIYRILFLIVIEERDLIFSKNTDKSKREIYYLYYSIGRLRKLCEKNHLFNKKYSDLWIQLKYTFQLFENEYKGEPLAVKPLSGELFQYNSIVDLNESSLDNNTLLECFYELSVFINKTNNQKMRVNYASLNVEEFGSVYEGLLEFDADISKQNGNYSFDLVKGEGRSSSGSHYTPDELVHPLIKHSLDHVILEKLKQSEKEKALLSIRVCDVACGSGHILLSAARRIAGELVKIRYQEDQPSPEHFRECIREVIKDCIYGVDKNPLAVELCKVALWLEAHNPGEPLSFLDHHIKCGDAIVGLGHREDLEKGIPSEAFKALAGDDKELCALLRKRNEAERKAPKQLQFHESMNKFISDTGNEFEKLNSMPDHTPKQIEEKKSFYDKISHGPQWWRLRQLADMQTAQFFIPKQNPVTPPFQGGVTAVRGGSGSPFLTDAEFRTHLAGTHNIATPACYKATDVSLKNKFFHWFIEFPEIFAHGGFDCILGNPPFLGGKKLSTTFGDPYLECIKYEFKPIGAVDLVTFFFRRIFELIKPEGFQSLISTNTIAQGEAREDGLDFIVKQGGSINHAIKSTKWPGKAAVEVALVTITKQPWKGKFVLAGKEVKTITPYLDDSETLGNPFPLKQNEDRSYVGSFVLGKGFILELKEAQKLIEKDPKNKDVLFPYLNGDDLNNNPDQSPSRWVINFFDWPLQRMEPDEWEKLDEKEKEKTLKAGIYAKPDYEGRVAVDYPDCLEILANLVKPERQRWANDKDGNEIKGEYALRKPLPYKWWVYADKRPALYRAISTKKNVMAVSRVTKYLFISFSDNNKVFSEQTVIFAFDSNLYFSFIHNTIHDIWAWKNGSTLGTGTLRYSASDCFETFPTPQNLSLSQEQLLEQIGEQYHEHRRKLMLAMQLGLTKTYNLFHSKGLALLPESPEESIFTIEHTLEKSEGKDAVYLWKHLHKTPNICPFNQAVSGILELRKLHVQMDNAVLAAYGWTDISLSHDFYEVDYLPENDRIRFTISPLARKEILKRLLQLNYQIHEQELAEAQVNPGKKPAKRKAKKEVTSTNQPELF